MRVTALKEFTYAGQIYHPGDRLRMSRRDVYHYKNLGDVIEDLTPENRQKK